MSYDAPTAAQLKARLPNFADVSDDVVLDALVEAGGRVSAEVYSEVDYQPAIIYLAAHNMTLNGLGTGAEAAAARAGTLGFNIIRSGQLTLQRRNDGSSTKSPAIAALNLTSYGKRYLELLRLNSPGVITV